ALRRDLDDIYREQAIVVGDCGLVRVALSRPDQRRIAGRTCCLPEQGRGAEFEDEIAQPSSRKMDRIGLPPEKNLAFSRAAATRHHHLNFQPRVGCRKGRPSAGRRRDVQVVRSHARVGDRQRTAGADQRNRECCQRGSNAPTWWLKSGHPEKLPLAQPCTALTSLSPPNPPRQ